MDLWAKVHIMHSTYCGFQPGLRSWCAYMDGRKHERLQIWMNALYLVWLWNRNSVRSSVAHALYKVLESQTSGSMQPCIHAPNGTGYSLCNQTERAVLNYHNAACFYLCIENRVKQRVLYLVYVLIVADLEWFYLLWTLFIGTTFCQTNSPHGNWFYVSPVIF